MNIRSIQTREPAIVTFCTVSLLLFLAGLPFRVPTMMRSLWLQPSLAVSEGHVWQFLTYAVTPVGIFDFLIVSGALLWFGWHLEPRLGSQRISLLLVFTAFAGGLSYALVTPAPAPPLAGGAIVASGVGSSFLVWTVVNRSTLGWGYVIFWLFAASYVALVLFGSPRYIVVPNLAAWIVAVPLAFNRMRRAAA